MAFNTNNSQKSKSNFSARMVSNVTQATVSWVNITDDFSRKVLGCDAIEATYAQAIEVLPSMLDNDRVSVVITDLTAARETISADQF